MEIEKINFWNPSNKVPKPKASIHVNGKLGFNDDAAKLMGLDKQPSFLIGTKDEDPESVFLVHVGNDTSGIIKTAKAGSYYYLSLRHFFDTYNIPFSEYRISYDISKEKGTPITYKLHKRANSAVRTKKPKDTLKPS